MDITNIICTTTIAICTILTTVFTGILACAARLWKKEPRYLPINNLQHYLLCKIHQFVL